MKQMLQHLACARLAYATPTPSNDALAIARSVYPNALKAFFYDASTAERKSDAQYYTIVLPDRLVFAFRGTSSVSDVLADVQIWMKPFLEVGLHSTQALVHRGFYKQFTSIKFEILASAYTHARKSSGVPVFQFIGHSLGGALATLAAAATAALLPAADVHCITFGSPRVGNGAFAALFDACVSTSVRCVHGDDIVTLAPRLWYSHVKGLRCVGIKRGDLVSAHIGRSADHTLQAYTDSLSTEEP